MTNIDVPSEVRHAIVMGMCSVEHEGKTVDVPPLKKSLPMAIQYKIMWMWQKEKISYAAIAWTLGFRHMIKVKTKDRIIVKKIEESELSWNKKMNNKHKIPKKKLKKAPKVVNSLKVPYRACKGCKWRTDGFCMLVGCAVAEGWG